MDFNGATMSKQLKGLSASGSSLKVMTIAGGVGGLAGFILSEVIQNPDNPTFFGCDIYDCTPGDLMKQTAVWFMFIIMGLGLMLSATQGFREKNVDQD